MDFQPRSDLACESIGDLSESKFDIRERRVGPFMIQSLKVPNEEISEKLCKPIGSYITFHCGKLSQIDGEDKTLLVRLLAGELRGMTERLTGKALGGDLNVFIAGLGNAELTADAIGPSAVAQLTVTRHLRERDEALYRSLGCCAISALAPGVMGQTGMETLEILRDVVHSVKADVVIVIDALAARSCERLASTVQLSDAGIVPGSGVGNHRCALTRESLGVPVIAVGIPTVVDSATLVYDALREASIEKIDDALEKVLETGKSFFVSPKDSDLVTARAAALLSSAIGSAFAPALHE